MARFVIEGGRRLSGVLTPGGNKNAALPMLAACLLTDEPVTLHRVPRIEDVRVMLEILRALGAAVEEQDGAVRVCAKGLRRRRLDPALCARLRASILLAGPLVARFGRATLAPPGGDVIGRRRLDTHLLAMRALGVEVRGARDYSFSAKKLKGADILLDEASVTGTENTVMAACLAEGRTVVFNAACEPHVQDLCNLLIAMGAKISGHGTNRIVIDGVPVLRGADYTVQPDNIEIGSYLAAAAITGGELTVEGVPPETMRPIAQVFGKLGAGFTMESGTLRLPAHRKLRVMHDYGFAVPRIEDGIWPSFPSDLMSVAVVMAVRATGTVIFYEKMFESRLYFVDRLIEMGARIVQCDPHRVVVVGPSRLHRSHLVSPDIRAGMALILAALCAKGKSVVDNAQCVDRGYERIDEKLCSLGAAFVREG
ncbi:MAG: UDP-N-acetylglucosamine 1-carboxyvinyltransferase [Kiritimatiellia bacterium]